MPSGRDVFLPIFAAVIGSLAALAAHVVPPGPSGSTLTSIAIDSPTPGAEFVVISDVSVPNVRFATPVVFELAEADANLVVVPLDEEVVLEVRTVRPGVFESHTTSTFGMHTLTSTGVGARGFSAGQLETVLAESGATFVGVHFGDGLACVEPTVWNLTMEERLPEALAACLAGAR